MKSKYNLKSQIRSSLRKIWMWSPMRRDALNRAKVGHGRYVCPVCKGYFPNQQSLDVDHVNKVTPTGFDPDKYPRQWGVVIENMLYMKPEGLVAMCKACHKIKTAEEKREAKIKKKTTRKAKRPKQIRKARAKRVRPR